MKKLFLCLWCLLLAFSACTNEEEIIVPSKGEEAVEEIVKVLEEKDDISQFVEVLKAVDVKNLEEEELTVFAVKNRQLAMSRSAAVDSVSIKRHIAKGSYNKSELEDGQVLESLSGDKLYISRNEDDVYVNGVIIEGEAIPAGKSFVYVVPEVIEEKAEPMTMYTTTVKVLKVTPGETLEEPLKDIFVSAFEVKGDSLGIYFTKGDTIGTWRTDENGEVKIKHFSPRILYLAYGNDYSYIHNGYIIAGITQGGVLIYRDINMDGQINLNDKAYMGMPFYTEYDGESNSSTSIIYMTSTAPTEIVPPTVDEMYEEWNLYMLQHVGHNYGNDNSLVLPYLGFDYKKDIIEKSDEIWSKQEFILSLGEKFVPLLQREGTDAATELMYNIQVDMCLVNLWRYGYFHNWVKNGRPMPVKELMADMEKLETFVPEHQKYALKAMQAKLCLINMEYDKTIRLCDEIINSGKYQLGLNTPDSIQSKEVIYGYEDKYSGVTDTPLILREVYVMKSYAEYKRGNEMEALRTLNILYISLGEVERYKFEVAWLKHFLTIHVTSTGQIYPYAYIFESDWPTSGFSSPMNRKLRIPDEAIYIYPGLMQNEGY